MQVAAGGAPLGAVTDMDGTFGANSASENVARQMTVDRSYPGLRSLLRGGDYGQGQSGHSPHDYTKYEFSTRLRHLTSLPSEIVEQFERRQFNTAFGIFPEISRAWCTIDSDFFMWDYVDRSDYCVYEGLSEIITSVALVPDATDGIPGKDGEVNYYLVLATPVIIRMFGLEFRQTGDDDKNFPRHGTIMSFAQGKVLQAPTDNVTMHSMVGTPDGRVFMGGHDGCLYELMYHEGTDSWFTGSRQKCRKINHTGGGLSFLIPSLVRTLLVTTPDPITQLLHDRSRNMLYAWSPTSSAQSGTVSVFRLDPSAPSRVELCPPLMIKEQNEAIASLSVLPRVKERAAALAVITVRGNRMYFDFKTDNVTLEKFHTRELPLDPVGSPTQINCGLTGLEFSLMATRTSGAEDVLLSVQPQLFRNASAQYYPAAGYAVHVGGGGGGGASGGLVETLGVNRFPQDSPVLIWDMAKQPDGSARATGRATETSNALVQQQDAQARVVVLTTAGTYLYTHHQPIDDLALALRDHASVMGAPAALQDAVSAFFWPVDVVYPSTVMDALEPRQRMCLVQCREAVASALVLACSTSGKYYSLRKAARDALERHGGKPILLNRRAIHGNAGGHADVKPLLISCKYDGMCQYLGRLLREVWDTPMVEARDLNAVVTPEQYARLERQNLLPRVELRSACATGALLNYIDGIMQFVDVIRSTCSDVSDPVARGTSMNESTRVAPPLGAGGEDMVVAVLRDPQKLLREEQRQILFLHDYASLVLEVLRLWVLLTGTGGGAPQQDVSKFTQLTAGLDVATRKYLVTHKFQDIVPKIEVPTDGSGRKLVGTGYEALKMLTNQLLLREERKAGYLPLSERLHSECPRIYNAIDRLQAQALEASMNASINASKKNLDQAFELYKQLFHMRATHDPHVTWLAGSVGGRQGLAQVCDAFVELKWHRGAVDLALTCAAIRPADGSAPTALHDSCRAHCYEIIVGMLQKLVDTDGTENESIIDSIISQVISTNENGQHIQGAHEELFKWHHRNGRNLQLIRIRSKYLEPFLQQLDSTVATLPVRELLVGYYEHVGKFVEASKALFDIARNERMALPLSKRREILGRAVGCGKSSRNPAPVDVATLNDLNDHVQIAEIQWLAFETLQQRLRANGDVASATFQLLRAALDKLDAKLYNSGDLWEMFFEPFDLWICKLEAVIVCNTTMTPSYMHIQIRELCDKIIQQLIEDVKDTPNSMQYIMEHIVRIIGPHQSRNVWFPIGDIVSQLEEYSMRIGYHDRGVVVSGLLSANIPHGMLFELAYKDLAIQYGGEHAKQQLVHIYFVISLLFEDWLNTANHSKHPLPHLSPFAERYVQDIDTKTWTGELKTLALGVKERLRRVANADTRH
eukprot:m.599536 g.599536  ORF g.599536 m.599536 type:complete len:1379 (-) comp22426_c0_seq2:594-4730(-)